MGMVYESTRQHTYGGSLSAQLIYNINVTLSTATYLYNLYDKKYDSGPTYNKKLVNMTQTIHDSIIDKTILIPQIKINSLTATAFSVSEYFKLVYFGKLESNAYYTIFCPLYTISGNTSSISISNKTASAFSIITGSSSTTLSLAAIEHSSQVATITANVDANGYTGTNDYVMFCLLHSGSTTKITYNIDFYLYAI